MRLENQRLVFNVMDRIAMSLDLGYAWRFMSKHPTRLMTCCYERFGRWHRVRPYFAYERRREQLQTAAVARRRREELADLKRGIV